MQIRPEKGLLPTSRKTLALAVGGAIIIAVCVFYLSKSHSDETKKPDDTDKPMLTVQGNLLTVPADSPLRKRLVVAPVSAATAAHKLNLPAVVEADPSATINILPPLTGRLTELKVKLGDTVKAGQVLAVINSPDLAQAWSDFDKAHDALELTRRAQERGQGVNTAGANSTKDLEQINSNFNQAQAEFNRAEQRLNSLGVTQDSKSRLLQISAPVAGSVTALNNGAGSFINDPTAAIMTISNLDHVWVTANVPENLVSALHQGQQATVSLDAWPGQIWKGKVDSVSALLDADSRRNKARILFKNSDGRLKPNMYANVRLDIPQNGRLMVPTSALLMNNDSITVFVEVAPWSFTRRTVTVGSEDGDQVSVNSGLVAGERIIVRGGVLIND